MSQPDLQGARALADREMVRHRLPGCPIEAQPASLRVGRCTAPLAHELVTRHDALARALAESEKRVSKVIDAAERVMQWYDNHEPWTPGREFQALRSALDAAEEARWSEFDRAALLEGESDAR